jgi:protein-tyrosine kinase
MERIKEALEKAQEKRKISVVADNAVSRNIVKGQHKYEASKIEYSQTQVINVDQKALWRNRLVAGIKDHPIADHYKILRTKVLQKMKANDANVLAVTSPSIGTGKSLSAINLAISMSMDANHSVLLVDLDFRRPSLHKYFEFSPEKGLIDYLNNNTSLADLLIHPGIESLVLLPAGKSIKHSSELLSTPKMKGLFEEIKHRYKDRIVIIDLPPLLVTDDALVVLPFVDKCLLIVGEGETTDDEIKKSLALIDEEKFMGTVLNKSDENFSSHYY